jgi:LPXTG-motif cell wall-anchored protein
MTKKRTTRALVTAVIAVLCVGPFQASAANATVLADGLIVATPSVVTAPVPAPGHSEVANATVENVHSADVDLVMKVAGPMDNILTREGSLLTVQVTVDGTPVGQPAPVAVWAREPLPLTSLTPGSRHDVQAVFTLDKSAGNEYAGVSSEMRLIFDAQAADPATVPAPGGGGLAATGAIVPLIVIVGAAAAVIGGLLLRRHKRHDANPKGAA